MTSSDLVRPAALSCLLAACFTVACGGAYVPSDDDGGAGGLGDTGGQPAVGGSLATGGAPASGGQSGAGGCCLAAPLCDEGDTQIEPEDNCPTGASCYSNSVCCSTILCMRQQATCQAIPSCQDGEVEVSECPEGVTCVERTVCGTTILCEVGAVLCEFGESVHVKWAGHSAEECQLVDYSCPEHTTGFSNECGCGCMQPETCPEFVDCEPGGTVDPLCDSEECPYSARAF